MKIGTITVDMAHIPFIDHERAMTKAYAREQTLKWLLIGTNTFWIIICFICAVMR